MTRSMTARSKAAAHADSRSAESVSPVEQPGDAGFTMAEVVVAMALFMIVLVASVSALYTIVRTTAITQKRVAAANLARQEIERLRGENLSVSQLDAAALTPTVGGTTYTVTPTMNPGPTADCAAGSSRQVTVVVSWNNSGARSLRYDTVLSC